MTSSQRYLDYYSLDPDRSRKALKAISITRSRYGRYGKSRRDLETVIRLAQLSSMIINNLMERGTYTYDKKRNELRIRIEDLIVPKT